jgi:hypothetical protein
MRRCHFVAELEILRVKKRHVSFADKPAASTGESHENGRAAYVQSFGRLQGVGKSSEPEPAVWVGYLWGFGFWGRPSGGV